MVRRLVGVGVLVAAGMAQVADSPGAKMAATVMRIWPEGRVSTQNNPGTWGYEEGVLLDGLAACAGTGGACPFAACARQRTGTAKRAPIVLK